MLKCYRHNGKNEEAKEILGGISRSKSSPHYIRHDTDYNKPDGLSPSTRKLTGHNSGKTQSPILLRPPYSPTYTLPR